MTLTFDDLDLHRSRSNVQKMAKIYKMGHISGAISLTDFILGTKVQPTKTHSMTQAPMTLTFGQGPIFPKTGKNQRTGHISEAISPTDFILGTKVQQNKAHSMTQVPMNLTQGQGQRSRSNFHQFNYLVKGYHPKCN